MTQQNPLAAIVRAHQSGRLAEAETAYRAVLASQPNHHHVMSLLGILLAQRGNHAAALEFLTRAIAIHPAADYYYNRALVFRMTSRLGDAFTDTQSALAVQPSDTSLQLGLANLLHDLGRDEEAIEIYNKLLASQPKSAETWYHLSLSLTPRGRLDDAVAAAQRAVDLSPDFAQGWNTLGSALAAVGQRAPALAAYSRALELNPNDSNSHSIKIGMMFYSPDVDALALRRELGQWNQQHALPFAASIRPHENDRSPDRKLRVGYVSGDFRDHVVGWNILRILRGHNRDRFEIFCYANNRASDEVTTEFRESCDTWRSVASMTDDQAAQLIRDDRIDILVDLSMHTAGNRLLVFARKPAPVQISYLGYCGGCTGLTAIDYHLSDPWIDPVMAESRFWGDTTLRLPHSYWCYQPGRDHVQVSLLPARKNGHITFINMNGPLKTSEASLKLWNEVLRATPTSRLLLYSPPGSNRDRLLQSLPADRVDFVGIQDVANYLRTYHRADICLDTTPFNGGISSCDALWMGVPVITLAGQTPVGRAGCSILANLGLSEFLADTPAQFVEIAATLARDIPRLSYLRENLRSRMLASPLMNRDQFIRDLESTYRDAWRNWSK